MTAKAIAKIRAEAASHFNGVRGFDNTARRNAYVCEDMPDGTSGCGHFIITVDREPGVTPAMVACGNCGTFAGSKFYRIADGFEPTHEWYRPETLDECKPGERDHVERGGLLLRMIGGGSSKDGWQKPEDARKVAIVAGEGRSAQAAALASLATAKTAKGHVREPTCEVTRINRADYPNRQQYREACRRARSG